MIVSQKVPAVDLAWQHAQIADEVRAGFDRVLETTGFILGAEAEAFERAYSSYCGVTDTVGVGSGTDAVELALRGAGVAAGDEVIIPANTFVATAEGVARAGGVPVLVDCDEDYLIDVEQAAAAVTPRTRAVVGVHLYGRLAPIERLRAAVGPGVAIVEDAAQSQGARSSDSGLRSGALGDVAATSFYPGKNLGAYGDAGAVTTSDPAIAERVRRLRNHGGTAKYEHLEIGTTSRLDGLQAVVLSAKLARLDAWNERRRAVADRYDEALAGLPGVVLPRRGDREEHVHHLYVVRVPERDRVVAELNAQGIGAAVHYPAPVHRTPAFAHLGGSHPRSEAYAAEILSLPIHPGLDAEQQEHVIAAFRRSLG
ncbi:DegT/DnrJ/EryC1/StrS family aminotransferase [Leifsonia sp. ZF2019]|uniref:DegT/DnrJ/EryC1/StrS family aminotransferase n=1 Tax=Leifsonia sp. ZF2019 TaxID=2781978 RepID=UPI001CBFF9D8|nr:DegT/DnrJ/EryC1/StrS family aminotransferase [Leifsonia sp. ZF2019]UAJ78976.1 DegT/DnrJ/EryC1/StrS family aminotransferase [Leifsonia sp. ZF2019]